MKDRVCSCLLVGIIAAILAHAWYVRPVVTREQWEYASFSMSDIYPKDQKYSWWQHGLHFRTGDLSEIVYRIRLDDVSRNPADVLRESMQIDEAQLSFMHIMSEAGSRRWELVQVEKSAYPDRASVTFYFKRPME